jgi:DNA-directed RNA polymerase subunit RPC12/RpoP
MNNLKTIKTMVTSLPHQTRYVTEHSECAMCDTKLEIRHEINKNDLKIKEEAHCPSCGIRVRSSQHLMH